MDRNITQYLWQTSIEWNEIDIQKGGYSGLQKGNHIVANWMKVIFCEYLQICIGRYGKLLYVDILMKS